MRKFIKIAALEQIFQILHGVMKPQEIKPNDTKMLNKLYLYSEGKWKVFNASLQFSTTAVNRYLRK